MPPTGGAVKQVPNGANSGRNRAPVGASGNCLENVAHPLRESFNLAERGGDLRDELVGVEELKLRFREQRGERIRQIVAEPANRGFGLARWVGHPSTER